MTIVQLGTFDIENYGDLLFPLLLERRMQPLGEELLFASPRGGPPIWSECVATVGVEKLDALGGELRGVVLGGGNLVHASPWNAPHYDTGGLSGFIAYPRLWLGGAHLAATHDLPFCWNAPGVPRSFDPAAARLVQWAASVADYVSVRDRPSAQLLASAGVEGEVHVVPDPAVEVSRVWPSEAVAAAYADAFARRGRPVPERTIAVHLNRRYAPETSASLASLIDRLCKQADATAVLLAIGPCHGDDELQAEIGASMTTKPLVVDRPRGLLELAALIGRSRAFLGSSLHGVITACSFGVPAIAVASDRATGLAKFEGFLDQFQLSGWHVGSWQHAEERLPALLSAPAEEWATVLDRATPVLDHHWARIADAIGTRSPKREQLAELERLGAADAGLAYRSLVPSLVRTLGDDARRNSVRAREAGAMVHAARDAERHSAERLRELTDLVADARRTSELAAEARSNLERSVAHRDADLARLRGELDAAGRTIAEWESRATTAAHRLARADERVAEAERRLARRNDELAMSTTQLARAQDRLLEAESGRAAGEAALDAARADVERLDRLATRREQALDDARAAVSRLTSEAGTLRAELATGRATVEEQGDRLRALENELAAVRRGTAELEAHLNASKRQLKGREARLRAVSAELVGKDQALAAATDQAAALSTELGQSRELVDELHARVGELTAAASASEAALSARDGELQALAERLADDDERLSAAGRRLAGAERETETARSRVSELEAQLALTRDAQDQLLMSVSAAARTLMTATADLDRTSKSRSWRWGHGFFRLLRRLTFRPPLREEGGVEKALTTIAQVQRGLEAAADGEGRPQAAHARPAPRQLPRRARRLKVSVICWDMAHNPLTRGNLLAEVLGQSFDVEIVGALFDKYGTEIWQPLRDAEMPMRTFPGTAFPEHFRRMQDMARTIDGDIIYACKPRIPSLGLAALAKEIRNRPLILDSDDREVSFFGLADGFGFGELKRSVDDPEFLVPYGRVWTQYCDSIVNCADSVTVSNAQLTHLYDALVIPHVRDEHVFDPRRYDRAAIRQRFGFRPDERVILFAGTPRGHKGIQGIAGALRAIGNPAYKLCVIGTVEDRYLRAQLEEFGDWIRLVPYQPFSEIAPLLVVADLICALQDPANEISRHQIPAKVTDAMAMEIPCLTTKVPPLEPLAEQGLVEALAEDEPLEEKIDSIFRNYEELKARATRNREAFLQEYSYGAVRKQLEELVLDLAEDPPPLHPELEELLAFQRSVFGGKPPAAAAAPVPSPSGDARPRRRRPRNGSYDIVMFWKQNDTGIYGRRQDMLIKHLAQSSRVNRIIHFDEPLDTRALRAHFKQSREHEVHQSGLVLRQTLQRVAGLKRDPKVVYRTFLHAAASEKGNGSPFRLLPPRDEYLGYVADVLGSEGLGERPMVFWVYPRNFDFPAIADSFRPDLIVADVMDDHRTWVQPESRYHAQLTENYRDILGRSDLVITNCEPLREVMSAYAHQIHVVPNACELPDPDERTQAVPRELRRLRGPLIGYVGNMSSRIDVALLDEVARSRPEWELVMIGSAHLSRDVLRLQELPNVHFLGVKPYPQVTRYIRAFDVAMIPHVEDEMTRTMNPLKAFVYSSQNVPVVSTQVANLPELEGFLTVATDARDFIEKIETALRGGRRNGLTEAQTALLAKHSWNARVSEVLDLLEQA